MWAHSLPKHVEKKINVLRRIVHQVGFIYKIIQGYTLLTKHFKKCIRFHDDNMEQSPFEKLIISQLVKFPAFRGTHSFIILPKTQISAFHPPPALTNHILFVHFEIILHSTLRPFSSCLPVKLLCQKTVNTSSLHHTCYKSR